MIGGIATVLHGVPRATFDLDILGQLPGEGRVFMRLFFKERLQTLQHDRQRQQFIVAV